MQLILDFQLQILLQARRIFQFLLMTVWVFSSVDFITAPWHHYIRCSFTVRTWHVLWLASWSFLQMAHREFQKKFRITTSRWLLQTLLRDLFFSVFFFITEKWKMKNVKPQIIGKRFWVIWRSYRDADWKETGQLRLCIEIEIKITSGLTSFW